MAVTPSAALGQARPDLRDGLEEFDLAANQAGFIGLNLAPVIEVVTQSGKYPKIELAELLKKKKDAKRASGANYATVARALPARTRPTSTERKNLSTPATRRSMATGGTLKFWPLKVLAIRCSRIWKTSSWRR
jgi:hypothetical protein